MTYSLERQILELKKELAFCQKEKTKKQNELRSLKGRNDFLENYPQFSQKAYELKRKGIKEIKL